MRSFSSPEGPSKSPPPGSSFFDADYEPLWAAAAAARMPISLHILGGRKLSMNIKSFNQNLEGTFYGAFETRQEIHRSVCELIAAGVFERHPDLRVVAAEAGIEYAANLERKLDSGYTSLWKMLSNLSIIP